MAPRTTFVVAVVLLVALAVLVSGGHQAQQAVPAPAPAPLLIRGAEDAEYGSLARGTSNVVVGKDYVDCLETHFSRCLEDPTPVCIEDALVDCGSLEAAAAPAATPTGAPAPLAGDGAAAGLFLAIGGIVLRGATTVGAMYINCVKDAMAHCYWNLTTECIKKEIGARC